MNIINHDINPKTQIIHTTSKGIIKEFEGRYSIPLDEYAFKRNIELEEAIEYDLDCDGRISIAEELCRLFAQKLFKRQVNPTVILDLLYNKLRQQQVQSNDDKFNVTA